MRNVKDVILEIIVQIPDDFTTKTTVVESLTSLVRDEYYPSPEGSASDFKNVSLCLEAYLGEPDTPWKQHIKNIMQSSGGLSAPSTSPEGTKSPTEGFKCRVCDLPRGAKIRVPEGILTFQSVEKDTGGSYCIAEWIDKGSKAVSLSSITPLIYKNGYYELA